MPVCPELSIKCKILLLLLWKHFTEEDKALELAGGDERPESEEVRVARDELRVLHEEKHKTQRVIATIQKELETAQNKTRKLAEVSCRNGIF